MFTRCRTLLLTVLALAVWPGTVFAAANVALDNILLSKVNGISTVQIWPACRMRYVDHSPFSSGIEVRIRVNVGPDCDDILGEVISERYAPPSLHLANVDEVVFDQLNPRDIFITLRFSEPQTFEVRQHTVGWIEVYVDTTIDPATVPSASAKPLTPDQVAPQSSLPALSLPRSSRPAPRPAPSSAAPPATRANVPPSSSGDFVVQLGVFEDAGRAERALLASATKHFAYRTELLVNGQAWYGLQLGFFDTEAAAEQVAQALRHNFPDAWVRYVDPDEASVARASGDLRSMTTDTVVAVGVQTDSKMTDEQLTALMSDGRRALLERQYADAIRLYTRVLQNPEHHHRAEAREMLGIAFERGGRIENAIAEYRAFQDEFPDNLGGARVSERLIALETASLPQSAMFRQTAVERQTSDGWQIHGGLSNYYWRNEEQLVHDGNYRVSSSGVLALGDISASRRGERFDVLARFNGAYQLNLVDYDPTGNIGWVSDAFVDVLDHQLGVQGRIGRQKRRSDGVLGHFDGIGVRYQWQPDISFSVSSGIPVDSPRYISDGDRFFYAASASVENLLDGRVSASAYTHQQTVDGIWDRQAIGSEALYRGDTVSIFALLDFDVSYEVLNTALVNATWRLENGWSVSGRVDFGAQPYLTTRNALAGQSVATVDNLLNSFSEGQIRTLARDRTAQSTTVSLGISAPLGERFDVSLDATMRQVDETVASGGVVARPDTGNEVFLNATLAATSLFRDNDLMLISVRYDALQSRDTAYLMLDSRLPLSRYLRINPRVTVTHHDMLTSTSTHTIVSPALRVLFRYKDILLDFEAGARWSNRELPAGELDLFTPDGTEELLGGFVNIGYRWEF